ncbi:unnamed protein product, partial [Musa hybrid cultivar]
MVRKRPQTPLPPEEPASAAAAASLTGSGSKTVVLKEPGRRRARFAEMAGETAAECAAVCCCCPCGLVNLLVVVVVKLPAGLVRKALRRIRNRSRKKAAVSRPKVGALNHDDVSIRRAALLATAGNKEAWPTKSPSEEILELEKVMLANFYGAGFWRSPSQRESSGKPLFQFPRWSMTLKCGQRLGQKMFFWIFSLKKPVTVTSFCLIDGSEISSGDEEAEIGK